MKKILAAAFLLLMVAVAVVPIFAQNPNGLNAARAGRNPVKYAGAGAYSDGRGVYLKWETEFESKNIGFYVYRIVGGERQLVSQSLVSGAYLKAREEKIINGSYSLFDRLGDVNSVYVIESFNVNGQRHDSALIQTQFVADLTTVAGVSSTELFAQSRNVNPETLRSESVLPKEVVTEVEANAVQADPITQHWVAAQPGAKIGVKNEGFYRVTRAELQAGGFDVSMPPARWQLYSNGVEQAITIGGNGDYIEFYGKGIDTFESDTQTYFLVVGAQNGKRVSSTIRRRVGGSVLSESYQQSFFKKETTNYSQNIFNGDDENFFGTVISSFAGTVNFNLSAVDFSVPTASLDIAISGITTNNHQVRVKINNVDLGVINGNGAVTFTTHFDFPTSALVEGANTLQLQSLIASGDISGFKSVKVNYARRYRAAQNQLSFYVPSFKATYIEGFTTPNIRVFDTTNPDAPALIENLAVEANGGGFRVYLPSNRGRKMFAVEDSAILQAASIVPNNPSTLSSTANNGELIIISYKDFLAEAEVWANYRRAQGITVKVVNVEDIFDEFNYGILSADSIRSFLQYAKGNWQTKPNYVLLLGDGSFDPRDYFGGAAYNLVPTRLVDTVYSETGSDDTMADFNNDGLAEIAIGRIPARDAATVTLVYNKVVRFEQTAAQNFNRGAVFAYDLPDGYDFEASSVRLRDLLPSNVPRVLVGRNMANAQTLLISELNNGRFLVNYAGHGNVGVWATNSFFGNTNAAALNNANLSIFTMFNCLNGYFIQSTDSMSEILLKNPNGGAVTAWASSGLTTPDVQEIMATRYYTQVAAGNITRMGDLVNDAKSVINFGRDVRLTWVLLGDPMLKVRQLN